MIQPDKITARELIAALERWEDTSARVRQLARQTSKLLALAREQIADEARATGSETTAPVPAPLTLTEAAAALAVTRTHLSLVKHGHRISPRLELRYQKLTGQPLRAA